MGVCIWANHVVSTVPLSCQRIKGSNLEYKSGHAFTYLLFSMDIEEGRRHWSLNGEVVDLGLVQC